MNIAIEKESLIKIIKWADEAWATLDHNEHENLVSELSGAIDEIAEQVNPGHASAVIMDARSRKGHDLAA